MKWRQCNIVMRNFWIDADIDGRATMLSGGPRGKDGGMNIAIRMRDEGKSVVACRINCYECDGVLTVCVSDDSGFTRFKKYTAR